MIDLTTETCKREAAEIATEYQRRFGIAATLDDKALILETRQAGMHKAKNFYRAMDVIDRMIAAGEIKGPPPIERLCRGLQKLIDIWDGYPENLDRESWREGDFEFRGRPYLPTDAKKGTLEAEEEGTS